MSNLPSRLIGLFLAFMIMALGPAILLGQTNDLTMKRSTMNEMTNFIDKVTDTGSITDKEIADFYLGCSSNGAVMDVQIIRLVKLVNPNGKGGTYTSYTQSPNIKEWNKGDVCKVTVKAIDYTGIQRLLWAVMRFTTTPFDETLAGTVRQ